jgi:hypothetical protein
MPSSRLCPTCCGASAGRGSSNCAACDEVLSTGTTRLRYELLYRHTWNRPSTFDGEYYLHADDAGAGAERSDWTHSGKWMVFVPTEQVDDWWGVLRIGTERGFLGPSAKVATALANPLARSADERLICVYTRDWRDEADVGRVLAMLRRAGVFWNLSFKTDEATLDGRYGRGVAEYVSRPGSTEFRRRTLSG